MLASELQKLWEFLDNGELDFAEATMTEFEEENPTIVEENYQYGLMKTLYYIEIKENGLAKDLITKASETYSTQSPWLQFITKIIELRLKVLDGEFEKASTSIEQSKVMFSGLSEQDQINVKQFETDMYNLEALVLTSMGDYQNSLQHHEKCNMALRKENRPRQRAIILFNMGRVNFYLGQNDRAITFLEEAIVLCEQINYTEGLMATYREMVAIANQTGDKDLLYTYEQKQRDLKDKFTFEQYKIQSLQERNGLTKEINRLTETVQLLEKEIWSLKFQVDLSEIENDQMTSMSNTISRASNQEVSKLQQQLSDLNDSLRIKSGENSDLMQNIEELNKSNERLNNKLDENEEQNQELRGKIKTLEKDLKKSKQAIKNLETHNTQKEKSLARVEVSQIKVLEQDLSEVQELLRQKETEHDLLVQKYLGQIRDLNLKVEEMDLTSSTYSDSEQHLKKQYIDQQKQISSLQGLVGTKEKIISRLEQEVLDLTDKDTKREKDAGVEASILARENQLLKSQLNSRTQEVEELISKIEVLQQDAVIQAPATKISQPKRKVPAKAKPKEPEQKEVVLQDRSPLATTIEDLTSSSKLVDTVYKRIQINKRSNLKVLAMQSGISMKRAKEAVNLLEEHGFVKVSRDAKQNLVVSLK